MKILIPISNIFSFTSQKLNLLDFSLLGALLSNIALVFLAIIVTVFVLTVTLLGRAARISKEKRAEAEQKSKQDFEKDISLLSKKLNEHPDDIEGLKKKIDDLETKKAYAESQIREIERRYNALGLRDSVLIPGGSFLTTLLLEGWFTYISSNGIWQLALFCSALICLVYGIKRVIVTLHAVQEVSLNLDDYQLEQLQDALVEAFKTVESEREPKPLIVFEEKPPFVFKPNAEAKIEFEVDLKTPGNLEARNVDVWFLFSPEIEIVEGSNYAKPFKQSATYVIPSANTTRYRFDLVRKHTRAAGAIKIKTTIAGEFKLRYKVDCDGHVESSTSNREVGIIVQD